MRREDDSGAMAAVALVLGLIVMGRLGAQVKRFATGLLFALMFGGGAWARILG